MKKILKTALAVVCMAIGTSTAMGQANDVPGHEEEQSTTFYGYTFQEAFGNANPAAITKLIGYPCGFVAGRGGHLCFVDDRELKVPVHTMSLRYANNDNDYLHPTDNFTVYVSGGKFYFLKWSWSKQEEVKAFAKKIGPFD